MIEMFGDFYRNKRVFVTGHTGFKGSWLCEWLLLLGAKPYGYSLEPDTEPSLFVQLGLENRLSHQIADVRDRESLREAVEMIQPDVVFHLAAQPLVCSSYAEPIKTYATNVMGTAHLLDALRDLKKACSVVVVTTDKCYENREWDFGYRENDPLGGYDPYSSSKACAELVTQSFRRSYSLDGSAGLVALASARAGNVIGGGDWASNRIIPDAMRALSQGQPIVVRNPKATRPWQHVLEPLSGYLLLGQRIYPDAACDSNLCGAYNFGPRIDSNRTVEALVEKVLTLWPGRWRDGSSVTAPHEARLLNLNTDKAWHAMRWQPVWDFSTAVSATVRWYRQIMGASTDTSRTAELTQGQIQAYCELAAQQKQSWTGDDAIQQI